MLAHRTRIAALILAALAAGCSGDATAPERPSSVDVDALLAEASPLAYAGSAVASLTGGVPVSPAIPSKSCAWSATSSAFVCPSRTLNGVTFTRSFQLLDANGNVLATADRATLAAIRTLSTVAGTVSIASGPSAGTRMVMDSRSEMTLSGLRVGPHVLDGTATANVNGTMVFNGNSQQLVTQSAQRVEHLVLPAQPGPNAYPQSGRIVADQSSRLGDELTALTSHVEIVFNGTSTVTLTMTVGGFTSTCKVDLAKGGLGVCV